MVIDLILPISTLSCTIFIVFNLLFMIILKICNISILLGTSIYTFDPKGCAKSVQILISI